VGVEYLGLPGENLSVRGNFAFATAKVSDIRYTAVGVEAGARYYISGKPSGLFGEAGGGLVSVSAKDESTGSSATGTLIYPYAQGGYRFGSKVILDLALGAFYYLGQVKVNSTVVGGFSGFAPRIEIGVGYIF
jgi:hypothetical protein